MKKFAHANNVTNAVDHCTSEVRRGKRSDSTSCAAQEKYLKSIQSEEAVLYTLSTKNRASKKQLEAEREKLQKRKKASEWMHRWSQYETREAKAEAK